MKTEGNLELGNNKPRNTSDFLEPPEARARHEMYTFLVPPRGTNPTKTLISDCWPPVLRKNTFLFF